MVTTRSCAPDVARSTADDADAVERARRRRLTVAGGLTLAGTVAMLAYPTSTGRTLPPGEGGAGLHGRPVAEVVGGPASGAFRGSPSLTAFGPVVVEVQLDAGVVTRASVVSYPREDARDRVINDRAVPLLKEQTVDLQTSGVDAITGATATSEGYAESLQAALDSARRQVTADGAREAAEAREPAGDEAGGTPVGGAPVDPGDGGRDGVVGPGRVDGGARRGDPQENPRPTSNPGTQEPGTGGRDGTTPRPDETPDPDGTVPPAYRGRH